MTEDENEDKSKDSITNGAKKLNKLKSIKKKLKHLDLVLFSRLSLTVATMTMVH